MNKTLETYLDRRMLFIFLNGIASGFPWVIIGSAMTLWLKELGLSRTAIGFFGSVFAMYSINWIWAPLLDRVRLPLLSRFGQRRSWLLLLQFLLLLLIGLMSITNPAENLIWVSLLALCVATVSATQDVVIDAYRIEILAFNEKNKLPATAALATSGWWVGYGFVGSIALYLSYFNFSWNTVYALLALFMVIFMINTLLLREPSSAREKEQKETERAYQKILIAKIAGANPLAKIAAKVGAWFLTTLVEPLRDFFARFGYVAILILLFILLFKVGEAFLGRMSLVFYKEIGFTNKEIADVSKILGTTLTIIFSVVASVITVHYGLLRGLLIGGITMAASNLIFAYLAYAGADVEIFKIAIVVDNFTTAFSTVAFVAFISHLTNRTYTATQYALMASIGNFGRTVFASGSGLLVDSLGGDWITFFIITALMVIPSLMMLYWVGKKLKYLFD